MKANNFDVIVTDLRMDEFDGLDVLHKAKEELPEAEVDCAHRLWFDQFSCDSDAAWCLHLFNKTIGHSGNFVPLC